MQQSTRDGFQRRIKVSLFWIGSNLRLEALGHRLEMRPQPGGIKAVFMYGQKELEERPVDLGVGPQKLIGDWMLILEAQKKLDQEAAQKAVDEAVALQQIEDAE
jgi:hypothetical protein